MFLKCFPKAGYILLLMVLFKVFSETLGMSFNSRYLLKLQVEIEESRKNNICMVMLCKLAFNSF